MLLKMKLESGKTAIGTGQDSIERAEALIEQKIDIIVIVQLMNIQNLLFKC